MLTVDGIEKVVRTEPSSASGAFREVWFIGDVVVKRDGNSGETNRGEARNYEEFKAREGVYFCEETQSLAWHNGVPKDRLGPNKRHAYNIRFPKMFMVGDYLVAERVRHPHPCAEHREKYGFRCGNPVVCADCRASGDIQEIMEMEFGIGDMHGGNFCYDAETNTAYIVDIQEMSW